MEKVRLFQQAIKEIFEEIANSYRGTTNPLEIQIIFDLDNHHYQLLMLGWQGDDYIFQCLSHIDIKEGKIWIQWNDTSIPIENKLVKAGIPASEIVLGLKHPDYRQYTDFSIA